MESCVTGAQGMVLVSDGCPEKSHDAVAGILIYGAFIAMNTVSKYPEKTIQNAMPFFGIDLLGQFHGPFKVGKKNGNLFALPFQRMPAR